MILFSPIQAKCCHILMTSMMLSQHRCRWWLVACLHQAISWINNNLYNALDNEVLWHSQEMPMLSLTWNVLENCTFELNHISQTNIMNFPLPKPDIFIFPQISSGCRGFEISEVSRFLWKICSFLPRLWFQEAGKVCSIWSIVFWLSVFSLCYDIMISLVQ